jgi:hypothetical protein
VIDACFRHPLTDSGLEMFLMDWEKAQASVEAGYSDPARRR